MIFRIHSHGPIDIKDWGSRQQKLDESAILTIPDDLVQGNASKVATSIPNPFARMYLFDTAFQMVKNDQIGSSLYHVLVSDCLDMFQMLFTMGDTENIKIVRWDKANQLSHLKSKPDIQVRDKKRMHPHRLLGESIEMAMDGQRFTDFEDIFFIFYKNILIGGTSPLTIFFTTPNFKRQMMEKSIPFPPSTTGDLLFDNNPAALHERADDFRIFMYKFRLAYREWLGNYCPHLSEYIRLSYENYSSAAMQNNVPAGYQLATLNQEYTIIKIDRTSVQELTCGPVRIYKFNEGDLVQNILDNSGFVIQASVENYRNYTANDGMPVTIPTPLALVSKFSQEIRYIHDRWDRNTIVEYFSYKALHQRVLPNTMNIKYPYVTTEDFLEDKLVRMPFNINKAYFFTGFDGKFDYLLPIKKEYFNFFRMEDLERNLSITSDSSSVIVKLRIPIRNGNSIEFIKEYKKAGELKDVYEPKDETRGFGLGISPFYQVQDQVSLNDYIIMVVENCENSLDLKYYRFDEIIRNNPLTIDKKVRVVKDSGQAGSTYHRIKSNANNAFDLIEVESGESRGLIIPRFKKVSIGSHTQHFKFAVDFGTSNTHIAYSSSNDPTIKPFDIELNEMQMILLNESSSSDVGFTTSDEQFNYGFGKFPEVAYFKKREFIPSMVGANASVSYPIRTASCESRKFPSEEPRVFGNINIGFSLDSEERYLDHTTFSTNLKWGMESNLAGQAEENRIAAFFEQTLWMIKNKILMNQGTLDPDICWFIPISMKYPIRNRFSKLWREAADRVFGAGHQIRFQQSTESIVPYYYLATKYDFYRANDAVNIDIGGGTVDVIFLVNSKNQAYSTSFKFAGNDIWGDGITHTSAAASKKDSGFFQMMKDRIEKGELSNIRPQVKSFYNAFYKNPLFDSADMASFLFKYDKDFNFTSSIQAHPYLSSLLYLHYSALIYHLSDIIVQQNIDIPKYLTFTGKGSEYIKIIFAEDAECEQLKTFTKLLFGKFTGKPLPEAFEVKIAPNPKQVTANGGISMLTQAAPVSPKEIVHYGYAKDNVPPDYQPGRNMKISELDALLPFVLDNVNKFLEILITDDDLNAYFNKSNITFHYSGSREEDKKNLKERINLYARDSFTQLKDSVVKAGKDQDFVEESPFFWCLKDVFYRLSKDLYKISR